MGKFIKSRQDSDQVKIGNMIQQSAGDCSANQNKFRFPAQAMFLINSFLAFIIVYANKVVISVAIVAMYTVPKDDSHLMASHLPAINLSVINETTPISTNVESTTISILNATADALISTDPLEHDRIPPIEITTFTKSRILGSFFSGYIVSQVPAGRLAERFGAKWLLGISLLICSLVSFLMPPVAIHERAWLAQPQYSAWTRFYSSLYSVLGPAAGVQVLRSIQGFTTGVAHPCMHALITRWTPRTQRSMTTAFIYSGSQIGTVFIFPVTGYLASSNILGGWPSVYYLLGVFGVVWFICWVAFVFDTPDKHPFIDQNDLRKLKAGIGHETSHKNKNIPWGKVLTSVPVIALALTHFGQNFGYFMLLTQLPTYLEKALHYDLKQNGVISSLPYITQAITSWIASYMSDRVVKSNKYSLSKVRKTFNSIGFFIPGLCFIVIALFGNSATIVVISLILALGFNGFAMSGFHVTHVDMAPDFAGTLMGITNGLSNFNGMIAPEIVALLTDENKNTNWSIVFLIATGVYFITGIIFCLFGTSKLQNWAVKQPKDNEIVVVVNGTHVANGNLSLNLDNGNKCNGSCKNNKPSVLNGIDQICCNLTQNYSAIRKSSANFKIFDRKVGSVHSEALVSMVPTSNGDKSNDSDNKQHVNTAFTLEKEDNKQEQSNQSASVNQQSQQSHGTCDPKV